MGQRFFGLFIFSSFLIACPVMAQQQSSSPISACGDLAKKVEVKPSKTGPSASTPVPEAGKALVFLFKKT